MAFLHCQSTYQYARQPRILDTSFTLNIKQPSTTTLVSTFSPSPTGRSRFFNLTWLTKLCKTWTLCKGQSGAQCPAWLSNEIIQRFHSTIGPLRLLHQKSYLPQDEHAGRHLLCNSSIYSVFEEPVPHAWHLLQTPCWTPSHNLKRQVNFWSKQCQVLWSVWWYMLLWELLQSKRKQWSLDHKSQWGYVLIYTGCPIP